MAHVFPAKLGTITTLLNITQRDYYNIKYALDLICNYDSGRHRRGGITEMTINGHCFKTHAWLTSHGSVIHASAKFLFNPTDHKDVEYTVDCGVEEMSASTGKSCFKLRVSFDPGLAAWFCVGRWEGMTSASSFHAFGYTLLKEMWRQFRMDDTHQCAHILRARLFDKATHTRILNGRYEIETTEMHADLPVDNVPAFMQFVETLYSQKVTKGGPRLDAYLRMQHGSFRCGEDIARVMLCSSRRYVIFDMVNSDTPNTVALSIGFESEGIEAIIQAGRAQAKAAIERGVLYAGMTIDQKWRKFCNGTITCEAWCLERAMWILSHRDHNQPRGSFSGWIITTILGDVTHLATIANFTAERYSQLMSLDDKIVAAWQVSKPTNVKAWATVVAKAAGCSKRTVQSRQREWLERFGIDIALPHALYLDLLNEIGPTHLLGPRIVTPVPIAHENEPLQLVVKDWQRNEVVAKAVNSGPEEFDISDTNFGWEPSTFVSGTLH